MEVLLIQDLKMKWLIVLLGLVALILGLLPLINLTGYLPSFLEFIPREGVVYNVIISIIGVLLIYLGVKKL